MTKQQDKKILKIRLTKVNKETLSKNKGILPISLFLNLIIKYESDKTLYINDFIQYCEYLKNNKKTELITNSCLTNIPISLNLYESLNETIEAIGDFEINKSFNKYINYLIYTFFKRKNFHKIISIFQGDCQ